jgi:predicted transcriptional regulator
MVETDKITLIASITASYLRRNRVGVDQIGSVISSVTDALEQASKKIAGNTTDEADQPIAVAEKQLPAVSIKKSVQPEYVVCLEDGVHALTLKRHLQSAHGLTPQQYLGALNGSAPTVFHDRDQDERSQVDRRCSCLCHGGCREVAQENGAATLGTQNQMVEFVLSDEMFRRAAQDWAARVGASEATVAGHERPPLDEVFRRVRERMLATMEQPTKFGHASPSN